MLPVWSAGWFWSCSRPLRPVWRLLRGKRARDQGGWGCTGVRCAPQPRTEPSGASRSRAVLGVSVWGFGRARSPFVGHPRSQVVPIAPGPRDAPGGGAGFGEGTARVPNAHGRRPGRACMGRRGRNGNGNHPRCTTRHDRFRLIRSASRGVSLDSVCRVSDRPQRNQTARGVSESLSWRAKPTQSAVRLKHKETT